MRLSGCANPKEILPYLVRLETVLDEYRIVSAFNQFCFTARAGFGAWHDTL